MLLRNLRPRSSRIPWARSKSDYSYIDECPPPLYDTGCTFCGIPDFPADKQIDFSKNLAGTAAQPWKTVISFLHGVEDFHQLPSKLELVPGSLAAEFDHLKRLKLSPTHPVTLLYATVPKSTSEAANSSGRLQIELMKLAETDHMTQKRDVPHLADTGNNAGAIDAAGSREASDGPDGQVSLAGRAEVLSTVGISAASPGCTGVSAGGLEKTQLLPLSEVRIPTAANLHCVFVYPDAKEIQFRPQHLPEFIEHHLLPEEAGPVVANPFTKQGADARVRIAHPGLWTEKPVSRDLVLICGHTQRDVRCGKLAPLLLAEFQRVLSRENLTSGVDVSLVSHVGGHAYAGNVLYFPRQPGKKMVFYGHVTPADVQGIVHETILKGNIIRRLNRGTEL